MTLDACQREPRALGIFRSFRAAVIAPMLYAPSALMARSIRRRLRGGAAPVSSTGRGKAGARSLLDCQRGLGAFRDQPPLLLGQRGIQVQHKWIGIAAQLGDDERHALGHQPSYEGDIAREPADEMLERCIRIVANSTPSSNRGDEVQLQGRLTWRRCPYSHTSVNKRSAIRSF